MATEIPLFQALLYLMDYFLRLRRVRFLEVVDFHGPSNDIFWRFCTQNAFSKSSKRMFLARECDRSCFIAGGRRGDWLCPDEALWGRVESAKKGEYSLPDYAKSSANLAEG